MADPFQQEPPNSGSAVQDVWGRPHRPQHWQPNSVTNLLNRIPAPGYSTASFSESSSVDPRIAEMADDLVQLCLPTYQDRSLDDEDKFEKSEALIRETSTLKGEVLDDMIMRVCHQCRETAEADKSRRARPTAPSRPAVVVQTAESSKPSPFSTT
ncbi:MAG: hypothetical protein Q9181_007978, partial [Wetmoreana brouardii]